MPKPEEILGIILVLILGFGLLTVMVNYGIFGMDKTVNGLFFKLTTTLSSFAGKQTCMGFIDASEKWVKEGLGLPKTFLESDIVEAAQGCGISECIIPPDARISRTTTRDCLRTAITVVYIKNSACIYNFMELGYANAPECITEELDKILSRDQQGT